MKSTALGRESQAALNQHEQMSEVALVTTTHQSKANPLAQKLEPDQCIETSHNDCQAFLKKENTALKNKVGGATKTTITCVKGSAQKKVTAVKPVCPSGYTKKN